MGFKRVKIKERITQIKLVSIFLILIVVFSIISNAQIVSGARQSAPKTPKASSSSSTPAVNTGFESWYYYLDGMVNLASGNLYYSTTDTQLNELGAKELKHDVISYRQNFDDVRNIHLTRAYNSFSRNKDGPFGLGWTSYYLISLVDNGTVAAYNDEDGSSHIFTNIGAGNYSSPAGVDFRLRKVSNIYELSRRQDGSVLNFDNNGKLLNITEINGRSLNLSYDSLGRLTRVRSLPTGVAISTDMSLTISYNPSGRISIITDNIARTLTYGYDSSGRLISVIDSLGNTTRYNYDLSGNLLRIINREGVTTNFGYVNNKTNEIFMSIHNFTTGNESKKIRIYSINYGKNIASVIGPRGEKTTVLFNEAGNPIQTVDALGGTSSTSWDKNNRIIKYTDQNKNTYLYGYDSFGNNINMTDPLGNVYRREWQNINAFGQRPQHISLLKKFTNPRGFSVDLSYDNLGNVVSVNTPVGMINYTYDSSGNLASVRNPRGFVTLYSYDFNTRRLNITDSLGNTTLYTYDGAGRLISVKDKRGFTTTYMYDANDRLISEVDANLGVKKYSYNKEGSLIQEYDELDRVKSIAHTLISKAQSTTDAAGNKTSYTHDASKNLREIRDAKGNPTRYEYDLLNRLIKETDALGGITTYTYDAVSNLISKTDKNGNNFKYEYDALNRLVKEVDPLGNIQVYIRDSLGNVLNYTDKNNHTTTYLYGPIDRNIQTIDPLGNSEYYAYDAEGNLVNKTDKNGHKEKYEYDALNRLIKITDPLGNVFSYSYDANGNMGSITNARNYTTTMSYDGLNRLTLVSDPLGNLITFGYDAASNMINKTDQRGFTTLMAYDKLNRLTTSTNTLGGTTTYTYDANGNLVTKTDELGNTMTFTYDELNRLRRESDAIVLGLFTYDYDANGNLINKTDANNRTTKYTYDALDRMISTANPLGQTTTYNYDAHGNMLSMTDANSRITRYSYDALDRLTSLTSPLGKTINYTYDAVGNRIRKVDAKNQRIDYNYDFGDRLVLESWFNDLGFNVGNITYLYDSNGNLIHTENIGLGLNDSIDYLYDANDRLDYLTRDYLGFVRTINYTYDPAGNRIGVVYPDTSTLTYEYDARNLLTKITDSVAGVTTMTFDAAGRRTNLTLPTGANTKYEYDVANKVTSVLNKKSDGALISSYDYTYDGVGNRLSEIRNASPLDTTLYIYDAANRLNSVVHVGAGGPTSWTYDANGNRLTQNNTGVVNVTYNYDEDNRLLSTSFSGGVVTYGYDNNGNLISRTDASGTVQYTYDNRAYLVTLVQVDLSQVNYKYGADGNRISKITPTNTEYYFYDGDYLIEVLDSLGNQIKRISYTNFVDEPFSLKDNGSLYYYNFDSLGSVTSILNSSESVIASYKYRPFGEIRQQTGGLTSNPFLYVAREFDSESGLYYFRSRMYDPSTGRFTSRDPIALKYPMTISEHTNLYTYVENNPVNYIDPTGMSKHGVYVAGKWYYPDEYDMSSVKEAEAIENKGYEEAKKFVDDLNQKRKDMQKAKDKIEKALDRAWFDTIFDIAGLIVTIAGIFTANPFIAALGISLTVHHNIIGGAGAGDWAQDGVSEASNQGGQAITDSAGKLAGEIFSKASGVFNTMLGALEIAENAEKIGDLQGTLDGLRLADKIHDANVRSGLFSQMAQAMVDVATEAARNLAESDKRKDTPTQSGGGNTPTGPADTPTSSGGGSSGGVENPGVDVETPGHIDPPAGASVVLKIGVTNTGYDALKNFTTNVFAFNDNLTQNILLVSDESDGANFWYEQALNDTGRTYDLVFVDTQYTPLYSDDNASTKDLKDYDIVIWEASNDRIGTLALPAQPELEEYLNNSGCLFVGGEGIMYEWPDKNGTLMSDYMFANGFGMDTFDLNVTGVPATIGNELELELKGGDGSSFENFSSSIFSVRSPGVADFLYESGIAGIEAVHMPDNISNGTYKSVLFAYDFDSIKHRSNRTLVMGRILEFLNCQGGGGGPLGVPTTTPPGIPDDPPDSPTTGIPILVPVLQDTTVVTTTTAINDLGTVVVDTSTTKIPSKPTTVSVIDTSNFDVDPTTCTADGWTSQDLTTQPAFCHTDIYNAFGGVGQSWWCGQNNPLWVTPPGYGNNWNQFLSLPIVDISSALQPVLSFYGSFDMEPNDVVLLEIFNTQTQQWQPVTQFPSRSLGYQSFQSPPLDKNTFGNNISIRFHLITSPSGSDEDGLYDSNGAFFADEIQIFDGANPANVMYFNNGGDHVGIGVPPTASGGGAGDFWRLYAPNTIIPPSPSCMFAAIDPNTGFLPNNIDNTLTSPVQDLNSGPATNCNPSGHMFLTYTGNIDLPYSNSDTFSIEISTDTNPTWTSVIDGIKGDFGRVNLAQDLGVLPSDANTFQVRFRITSDNLPTSGRGLYVDDLDVSCDSTPPPPGEPRPKGGSPIFKKLEPDPDP